MLENICFDNYKIEIKKRFKENVISIHSEIIEDIGPEMKRIANSWKWVKTYNKMIKPFINLSDKTINEEKLENGAEIYANYVIEKWINKINNKLEYIDNPVINHMDGFRFNISGSINGNKIEIIQDMIINRRGFTLFNQFPARIYLNNKKISEKKYKEWLKG